MGVGIIIVVGTTEVLNGQDAEEFCKTVMGYWQALGRWINAHVDYSTQRYQIYRLGF